MGRYRSVAQYRAALNRRINALKRGAVKTDNKRARLTQRRAQRFAPQSSGETVRGIRVRQQAKGAVVESWVPGFKQNMWANQSPGYTMLEYPKGAWIPPERSRSGELVRVLPPGGRAKYGRMPVGWRWTGMPGFFDWAVRKTRKDGFRMHIRNAERSLRAA